jgi:hypothetical protein
MKLFLGGAVLLAADQTGQALATAQALGILGCGNGEIIGGPVGGPLTGIFDSIRNTELSNKNPIEGLLDVLFE